MQIIGKLLVLPTMEQVPLDVPVGSRLKSLRQKGDCLRIIVGNDAVEQKVSIEPDRVVINDPREVRSRWRRALRLRCVGASGRQFGSFVRA